MRRLPEPEGLRLRRHAALPSPVPGQEPVAVALSPASELMVLWSDPADAFRLREPVEDDNPGRSANPVGVPVDVVGYRAGGDVWRIHVPSLDLVQPHIRLRHDGSLLVVARYCALLRTGPEQNAKVFDDAGAVVTRATVGNDVAGLLVLPGDELLVGYDDMGVFGNFGWDPREIRPAARFDTAFQRVWEMPHEIGDDVLYFVEAATLLGDTPWVIGSDCLVQVEAGREQAWPFGGWAPDALLADGAHAAQVVRDEVETVQLHADGVTGLPTRRLVLPDGSPLPPAHVTSAGPELHVIVGGTWYRTDLAGLTT